MKARNKIQEATIQFAFIIKKSDLIMKVTRIKKSVTLIIKVMTFIIKN